ncbi:small ribosomal subunit protein mS31 [Neocloeon triangulifer]|uniref:small ribosomal subunit protein mS31 n=1 Tax=Neocloeon triangulifer TaxID=2078957 RepID=UPI00286F8D76|nr:small ribosomal subunit protein mS31 [Neocloeon triangulifer]XP_059469251.1 small ribosomal subunit protein mS31 [Neocloeon triangulifer]
MQALAPSKVGMSHLKKFWILIRTQPGRFLSSSSSDSSDSSSSDSDDEKSQPKIKKDDKKLESRDEPQPSVKSADPVKASLKLNELLQAIIKDDLALKAEALKLSTATSKKGVFKKITSSAEYNLGKDMADAIDGVASISKGNKEQVKADLVDKVASMKAPVIEHVMEEPLKEKEVPPSEPINLSELLGGMKVEKVATTSKGKYEPHSRSSRVKALIDNASYDEKQSGFIRRRPQRQFNRDELGPSAGLSESVPLGIFTESAQTLSDAKPLLSVWDKMSQRELRLAVTYPPSNIYEEMILWTNQGKLWKFPIDNEQGWEEEQSVPFSEHIFLEKHLQDWCPKKGPVRHFMELVCIGLSKNPHFTVEEKKAHIEGYREYFVSKTDTLKELGAM